MSRKTHITVGNRNARPFSRGEFQHSTDILFNSGSESKCVSPWFIASFDPEGSLDASFDDVLVNDGSTSIQMTVPGLHTARGWNLPTNDTRVLPGELDLVWNEPRDVLVANTTSTPPPSVTVVFHPDSEPVLTQPWDATLDGLHLHVRIPTDFDGPGRLRFSGFTLFLEPSKCDGPARCAAEVSVPEREIPVDVQVR